MEPVEIETPSGAEKYKKDELIVLIFLIIFLLFILLTPSEVFLKWSLWWNNIQ